LNTIRREQRGSSVAQAAAIAIVVAAVAAGMLGSLDRFQAGITDALLYQQLRRRRRLRRRLGRPTRHCTRRAAAAR